MKHQCTQISSPFKPRIYSIASMHTSLISAPTYDSFQSAACDTGAQKTVFVLQQASVCCKMISLPMHLSPISATFVFSNHFCKNLGMMSFLLVTHPGKKSITAHVVPLRTPLLLGLDMLYKFKWTFLTVQNVLISVSEGWSLPLVRKFGHVFLPWPPLYRSLYTRQQLQNFHLHFMHPSTEKLFNLLQRAFLLRNHNDTIALLDDISKACHACQVYSSKPLTFQVHFPNDVVFNKQVRLDLFYLDGKPVLHIINTGTNFPAARFLESKFSMYIGTHS